VTGVVVPFGPHDWSSLIERAMDRASGGRPAPGNRVQLLWDGPEVYPAMLERIAGARRWIHLDNYIIRHDAIGRQFAEALTDRARDRVRVRVLTDWLGSFGTSRAYWKRLRTAGVEVRFFGPPNLWNLRHNFTRDHRKILVTDGERAVTGGLCIGEEWSGDPARARQPWRDTGLAIDGPAATLLDRAFAVVWNRLGRPVPSDELAAEVPELGATKVRVLSGEPGAERVSRMVSLLLAGAAERIWVTDAYLVAPRGIFQALLDAAAHGVDVRLLVPGTSDLPHVRNVTRTGYRDLLRAGIRIFEWQGPMLHAKTVVADGRWVRIGSTNLNLPGLIANYELDVLLDDVRIGQQMEMQFRRDLEHSREVLLKPVGRPREVLEFRVPVDDSAVPHSPGLRERRHRAVVALRAVLSGSQRALFVQTSLSLGLVALLMVLFPRIAGLVLGAVTFWIAFTTLVDVARARHRPAARG
jgi:cardiolipin synthase